MSGTQLRTTALGAQVWSVGRNVAAAEAEGLIKGLKASHPDIERPLLA